MNLKKKIIILIVSTLFGFIVYNLNSNGEYSLFGKQPYKYFVFSIIVGTLLLSLITQSVIKKSFTKTAVINSVGVIFGVIILLFYEISLDDKTHNLFPLEIIITIFYVFPPAFLGAYLSKLIFKHQA